MPIDVCLTVDTEFDIAGTFADPANCRPIGLDHVLCPVAGQDQGLGFILKTLAEHEQQATFFIETMNNAYFDDSVMGSVVERLLQAQQDVQLHLHPCWEAFKQPGWQQLTPKSPPADYCADLPLGDLEAIIKDGVRTLKNWGATNILALRTGNLSAGLNVYQAMNAAGLKLASNIGAGYSLPADPDLHLFGGCHLVNGVMEIPVLSYTMLKFAQFSKQSMLSITGSSIQEIKQLLGQAAKENLSPVVIITHPFEFVKNHKDASGRRKNSINQKKLSQLCKFVADHPDQFRMATFGADGDRWLTQGGQASPNLLASSWPVIKRVIENKFNDKISFV